MPYEGNMQPFRPMGGIDSVTGGYAVKQQYRMINEYEDILTALNKFQRYLYVPDGDKESHFADLMEDRIMRDMIYVHFKDCMESLKVIGSLLNHYKRELQLKRSQADAGIERRSVMQTIADYQETDNKYLEDYTEIK